MNKVLENLLEEFDSFFIHYASDGFYDDSKSAPKMTLLIL